MKKKLYLAALLGAGLLLLCTVLPGVIGKYVTGVRKTSGTIRVVIKTLTFPIPDGLDPIVYDGELHSPDFSVPEYISVTGETSATDAGSYEVIYHLDDPHSQWEDGTTEDKIVVWQIVPKVVPVPEVNDTVKIYTADTLSPTIGSVTQDVTVTGSVSGTDPGYYSVNFDLPDTRNYVWSDNTSGTKSYDWMIGVCRIGTVLYPSVTEAFDTDLSNEDMPVEMLCHWSEEAWNEKNEDAFSLNGFSLCSDGVTIRNDGTLTLLGGGTIESRGGAGAMHAAVRNSGTLSVVSGVYEACYEGTETGGYEVYAFWNTDGETTIEDAEVTVSGGELASDAILVSGGKVIVNSGSYTVENRSSGHGSFAVWQEDGETIVNGGTYEISSAHSTAVGFMCEKGEMKISDAVLTARVGDERSGAAVMTSGTGRTTVTGGQFSVTGRNGNNVLVASGSSELRVTGGEFRLTIPGEADQTSNGILVSGGNAFFSGGSVFVDSSLLDTTSGVGVTDGCAVLSGGSIAIVSRNANAAAVSTVNGTVAISGSAFSVQSAYRAYGILKSDTAGPVTVERGSFEILGDFCSPGEADLPTNPITTAPDNTNAPFTLRYRSEVSTGVNWSSPPYIASVTQVPALFANANRTGEIEFGTFENRTGALTLRIGSETVLFPNAPVGFYTVAAVKTERSSLYVIASERAGEDGKAGAFGGEEPVNRQGKGEKTGAFDAGEAIDHSGKDEKLGIFSAEEPVELPGETENPQAGRKNEDGTAYNADRFAVFSEPASCETISRVSERFLYGQPVFSLRPVLFESEVVQTPKISIPRIGFQSSFPSARTVTIKAFRDETGALLRIEIEAKGSV